MQVNPSFRLAYVPGVTPGKWARVWGERLPDVPLALLAVPAADGERLLREGDADAGLVRLPVDKDVLSAIPLYTETTVVVFPKEHWLAAAEDDVALADLADDVVFHPLDDTLGWTDLPGRPAIERPATTGDAIELVAANVGVLLVPQSLARLHHRRDLTYRTVADAPQSQVALSWPQERTTDLVEEFIGIVRGRTVNSSRGRGAAPAQEPKKAAPARKPQPQKAGQKAGQKTTGQKAGQKPKPNAAAKRGKPRRGR
ncbi:LysR substrate-binding domain-containing protein [Streptomyces sp. SP17BM10]|uniref:LysR family substrate-binding domain-containing protein n=1 Tax=Streptomyces sp. SP17BM10 TaxID=3002530 RepID=UPI002E761D58|nr:LysR substrate-binding domain-containing protein [Streptomyces sp. SP17BM10]MEE1788730.1 LysR substrate-binding domain-containing protein [Streptomyces sp. SP17BM10]